MADDIRVVRDERGEVFVHLRDLADHFDRTVDELKPGAITESQFYSLGRALRKMAKKFESETGER